MANLIRSARSGCDWTAGELVAYNITVQTVDALAFFGQAVLPPTNVSPVILNNLVIPAGASRAERKFFKYMEDAIIGEESHVDDFAALLLDLVEYDDGERVIHSREELGFVMCGQRVSAKPDVCVVDHTGVGGCVILVQKDEGAKSSTGPQPQLIAEAIAAFSQISEIMDLQGQQVPAARTIPGIAMVGIAPVFYKIPVTQELLLALDYGQYPQTPTVIQRFFPPVQNRADYLESGMRPLDHRRSVFQCLEAMKALMDAVARRVKALNDDMQRRR